MRKQKVETRLDLKFTYKKGLKDGIPIALGYFAVSFAFGVSVVSKGMPLFIALFMSMTNLTSAGQVAGATVVIALGTFIEIILTQLIINARYFLMGITLSQRLDSKFTLLDRFLCSFGITDEIFGVAVSYKKPISKQYLYGLILLPFLGWSLGTLFGAIAGDILPNMVTSSLSIALYAMFIAIFIPAGMQDKKIFVAIIISVGLSCCFYYIPFLHKNVSSGIAYIICALVGSIVCALFFPVKESQDALREDF